MWQNRELTEKQWRTFLAEITCIINIRPLNPSSVEIWEEPPSTPNHIPIGQQSLSSQPEQEGRVNPRQMLRIVQRRVSEFWTCCNKYLAPTLLRQNKWFRKRENVEVGDLVLELNSSRKRSQWEMALIADTYPGKDGWSERCGSRH